MSAPRVDDRSTMPDRGLLLLSALASAGFVAMLLSVALSGGVDSFDAFVASRTLLTREQPTTVLARLATALGSFPAVVAVSLAAIGGLWLQTRQLWFSAILASSVAATASLVTLIKIAVSRPRPDVALLIGPPARDFAFPSGHTANGTLVYVLAALLLTARVRRVLWRFVVVGVGVALAALIGLSRVYLGYHWATDVLGGWLLAAAVIAGSFFTSRRLGLQDGLELTGGSARPAPSRVRAGQLLG